MDGPATTLAVSTDPRYDPSRIGGQSFVVRPPYRREFLGDGGRLSFGGTREHGDITLFRERAGSAYLFIGARLEEDTFAGIDMIESFLRKASYDRIFQHSGVHALHRWYPGMRGTPYEPPARSGTTPFIEIDGGAGNPESDLARAFERAVSWLRLIDSPQFASRKLGLLSDLSSWFS